MQRPSRAAAARRAAAGSSGGAQRTCGRSPAAARPARAFVGSGPTASRRARPLTRRLLSGNKTKTGPRGTDRMPIEPRRSRSADGSGFDGNVAQCTMGIPRYGSRRAALAAAATGGDHGASYVAAGSLSTLRCPGRGGRDQRIPNESRSIAQPAARRGAAAGSAGRAPRCPTHWPAPPCRRRGRRSAATPDGGRQTRRTPAQRSRPKIASCSRWNCFMRSRRASLN